MQIIIVQLPDKTRRTREQILKRKKERNKKEIVHHPAQIYDNWKKKNTCTTFRQIYAGTLG